jgi:hypothetical protein
LNSPSGAPFAQRHRIDQRYNSSRKLKAFVDGVKDM